MIDSCVLVVTTYAKKFGLHFKPTKKEVSNIVDCYTVAMRKSSSDNAPSGFESSFGSDPTHFVAKYSSINIVRRTSQGIQNLMIKNSNRF